MVLEQMKAPAAAWLLQAYLSVEHMNDVNVLDCCTCNKLLHLHWPAACFSTSTATATQTYLNYAGGREADSADCLATGQLFVLLAVE